MKQFYLSLIVMSGMQYPCVGADAYWKSFGGVSNSWDDLGNWNGWDPRINGRPYPTNWSSGGAGDFKYRVNVTIPEMKFVRIREGFHPSVMNFNVANTVANGKVAVEGWLTVHGGNAIIMNGRVATIYGNFEIRGIGGPSNFLSRGSLYLGSGQGGYGLGVEYLGVESVEIGRNGHWTLRYEGSRLTNWDNVANTSGIGHPIDLTERVAFNYGDFQVIDRDWMPEVDPISPGDPKYPRLLNRGTFTLRAETRSARAGGFRDGLHRHIRNSGTINVDSLNGFSAIAHLEEMRTISPNEHITLSGAGAGIRGGVDELQELGKIQGTLWLGVGARMDSMSHVVVEGGGLRIMERESLFACKSLRVEGGVVSIGHYEEDFPMVALDRSFEASEAPGVLTQPDFRAVHGRKSLNLAAGDASFSVITTPGRTYTLTFAAYGGDVDRSGKIVVTYPSLPDIEEFGFVAAGTPDYAKAEYQVRSVQFVARDQAANITFTAERESERIGPVIDSVEMNLDLEINSGLDVRGILLANPRPDRPDLASVSVKGWLAAESVEMNGALFMRGGRIRKNGGNATAPVPMTVSGQVDGHGIIFSDSLVFQSGARLTNWTFPILSKPLEVIGNANMKSGSVIEFWAHEHTSPAIHVLSTNEGNGNLVVGGLLRLTYSHDNPPLPHHRLTVARAPHITGSFANVKEGRVEATAEHNDGTEVGSFAVESSGTEIVLHDFKAQRPPDPLPPPLNDNFKDRIILNSVAVVGTTGDNTRGTFQSAGGEIKPEIDSGASVWFQWTAPATGWHSIHTSSPRISHALDTVLAVYSGDKLETLQLLGHNDESRNEADFPAAVYPDSVGPSRLQFMTTQGATYQIAVLGYSGGEFEPFQGPFELHIHPVEAPDFLINDLRIDPSSADPSSGHLNLGIHLGLASTGPGFKTALVRLEPDAYYGEEPGPELLLDQTSVISGTLQNGRLFASVRLTGETNGNGTWVPVIALNGENEESFTWTPAGFDDVEDSWLLPQGLGRRFSSTPGIGAWTQSNFTQEEVADTSISGASADADRDGIANLMEYGLGLDPRTVNPSAGMTLSGLSSGTSSAKLSFPVPHPFPPGIIVSVEAADAISPGTEWTTLARKVPGKEWISMNGGSVDASVPANGSGVVTVTWNRNSGSGKRGFLRLRGVVP
ncbi:MAG: DUF642 domain-containing protein [Verrucomicrobiaceae bacterium]|nr:MAG: DUF642 domain-containing protein [Verrucomicrobiaceae bacterium]